jgi:hypothetical protein
MRYLLVVVIWFFGFSNLLQASGMEPVELPKRSSPAVYILIDNPPEEKPAQAPPDHTLAIPRDVWLEVIIPYLSFNDQLRMRATCKRLRGFVHSPSFKTNMGRQLQAKHVNLMAQPDTQRLLEYMGTMTHLSQLRQLFPAAQEDAIDGKPVYEKLWRLRHVSGLDPEAVRQACEHYDVETQSTLFRRIAARQTGFHFRHPNLEAALQWVVPSSVGLALMWPLIQPSVWPASLSTGFPWVNFSIPLYRWDKFFAYQPAREYRVFYIDILPYLFHYSWHTIISTEVLLKATTNTTIHVTLDSLSDSVTYSGLPYRLGIAIPYGLLVMGRMVQLIRNKPSSELADLNVGEAYAYDRRTEGLLRNMYIRQRLWFVGKVLVSAGLFTAFAFNVKDLYDFMSTDETQFEKAFGDAVSQAQSVYKADYMGYTTYLGQQLRGSPVNPWRCENYEVCDYDDFCFTYLSPETFRNNTDLFVSHGLINPPNEGGNYENGVLRYPLIYVPCWMTFNLLTKYAIVKANTTVNVLYKYVGGAVITSMSQNILHHGGYWTPVLLPQVMIVLHILYLMFIEVW